MPFWMGGLAWTYSGLRPGRSSIAALLAAPKAAVLRGSGSSRNVAVDGRPRVTVCVRRARRLELSCA